MTNNFTLSDKQKAFLDKNNIPHEQIRSKQDFTVAYKYHMSQIPATDKQLNLLEKFKLELSEKELKPQLTFLKNHGVNKYTCGVVIKWIINNKRNTQKGEEI